MDNGLNSHVQDKERGNHYFKIRDYHSAIKYYSYAIEDATTHCEALKSYSSRETVKSQLASYYGNRAAAYTMINYPNEALEDCDAAIQCDPSFVKGYYRKGKILQSKGCIEDALKVFDIGVKNMMVEENRGLLRKERDDVLSLKGKYYMARDSILSCMEYKDKDLDEDKKEEIEKSLNQLNDILASCPNWKDVGIAKAQTMELLDRNDDALSLVSILLNKNPDEKQNAELSHVRAKCYYNAGKLDDAIQILSKIPNKDHNVKKLYEALSFIKLKKSVADRAFACGRFEEAVESYNEAISVTSNKTLLSKLFFNRAVAKANLYMNAEAVVDCTEALALDPDYLKAFLRRAASYVSIGTEEDFAKALDDYNRAEELAKSKSVFDLSLPGWKEAMLLKARALAALSKTQESYDLTMQLANDGGMNNDARLLLLQSKSLFYLGDLDESVKTLEHILESEPQNEKALILQKSLHELHTNFTEANKAYKSEHFEDAKRLYDVAFQICPEDNIAFRKALLLARAKANASLRDHKAVVEDCSEAIKLDPSSYKLYVKRGLSYLMLGSKENCEKAIEDFETAKTFTVDDDQNIAIDQKIAKAKAQMERDDKEDFVDYYDVLGVSRDASDVEIKRNYRKMALRMHPDRRGSMERAKNNDLSFRDVNLAYEVLSDASRRDKYDSGVDNA